MPALPQLSLPGFCFAYAMSSFTLLNGALFVVMSTFWVTANWPTGVKPFNGSYVMLFA